MMFYKEKFPKIKQTKQGSQGQPLAGIKLRIDSPTARGDGNIKKGELVIESLQPSQARTILGDHKRYLAQYYKNGTQSYFTGDCAYCDCDGDFWVTGRLDDVVNVSGHRLSTAELESILCSYPNVCEAACIGIKDTLTGEALVCFVSFEASKKTIDIKASELKDYCKKAIGSFACPKESYILKELPKTRSGKIMRRLLRDLANEKELSGDLSTLESKNFLNEIKKL